MPSARQGVRGKMNNHTISYPAMVGLNLDYEDLGFDFSNSYSSGFGTGESALAYTQSSIYLLTRHPLSNEAPTPHALNFDEFGSNQALQTQSICSYVASQLESQATITQPQLLHSGTGNVINNLPNSNFHPFDANASYGPNSLLPFCTNDPSQAKTRLQLYDIDFIYPDPSLTTTGRSMATSHNNDSNTSSAMNLPMPHTPHPPTRYHDLADHIKDPRVPSTMSPTPSTDAEWLSSSPDPDTCAETSPQPGNETEVAVDYSKDETEDAEEQSNGTTVFASLAEARDWRLQQQKEKKKSKDKTLPTDDKKRGIVADMVTAFGYMGSEAMTNADGTQRCTTVTASHITHALAHPKVVELLCWNLLEEAIRRCEGKPLSAVYGPLKVQRREATFANRIKGVIRALKISKNVCKHLFEPPFASRVVDSPWAEILKVERNVGNNKRKQALMKKAIKLEKDEEAEKAKEAGEGGVEGREGMEGEESVDEDETESDDGEPRPKRSRRRGPKKS